MSIFVVLGFIAIIYVVIASSFRNPEILISLAVTLLGAFLLYHTYITGKIRPTFRAGCYLWLIFFAGVSFTVSEITSSSFFVSEPPLPPAFIPTSTHNIALTSQTGQSNAQATLTARVTNTCLHWSKITSQMENKVTCVYGTISEHRENWENFLTNLYFGRRDQFFLVSNFRWHNSFEGECIMVTGQIKLNTYKVPYIKIEDSIDFCEPWMLNQ